MLKEEQLRSLPNGLQDHFIQLERDSIAKITKRIGEIGELSAVEMGRLDELQRIDRDLSKIQADIANALKYSEDEIRDVFMAAAWAEYDSYKTTYDLTGTKWVPFMDNEQLLALVESISMVTAAQFQNVSGTLGFINTRNQWQELSNFYQRTVDYAVLQVRTGQTDLYGAMHGTVLKMADRGITHIEWQSGYRRRLDSSARMNILGGLSALSLAQAQMIGNDIGADGFEISYHLGHRPTHDFGGQQFSADEFQRSIRGLMEEPNCYHRAFPIVLGVSTPAYTKEQLRELNARQYETHSFEGKQYTQYEAEQKQRRYETAIRKEKDRINALESYGGPAMMDAGVARGKLTRLQKSYREFSEATKLPTRPQRTTVVNRFKNRQMISR